MERLQHQPQWGSGGAFIGTVPMKPVKLVKQIQREVYEDLVSQAVEDLLYVDRPTSVAQVRASN